MSIHFGVQNLLWLLAQNGDEQIIRCNARNHDRDSLVYHLGQPRPTLKLAHTLIELSPCFVLPWRSQICRQWVSYFVASQHQDKPTAKVRVVTCTTYRRRYCECIACTCAKWLGGGGRTLHSGIPVLRSESPICRVEFSLQGEIPICRVEFQFAGWNPS